MRAGFDAVPWAQLATKLARMSARFYPGVRRLGETHRSTFAHAGVAAVRGLKCGCMSAVWAWQRVLRWGSPQSHARVRETNQRARQIQASILSMYSFWSLFAIFLPHSPASICLPPLAHIRSLPARGPDAKCDGAGEVREIIQGGRRPAVGNADGNRPQENSRTRVHNPLGLCACARSKFCLNS